MVIVSSNREYSIPTGLLMMVYLKYLMSSVVSFKVRRGVKEKMEMFKDRVNRAEELRRVVEERIRELEAEDNIRCIVEELEKIPISAPKGFSTNSVREDRDSN